MLVCCVCVGDKYPVEYVHRLQSMVARHCDSSHRFMCVSDAPIDGVEQLYRISDRPGWWAKLELFALRKPLVYFDLDVVITGDLTPLTEWDGFGIIQDWSEWGQDREMTGKLVTPMFNSSVMKLTGEEGHVWDEFKPSMMKRFARGGDQRWITARMPAARTFPPEWFASYKESNCSKGPPEGSLATIFHGHPKPHELSGWVAERWK